VSEPAPDYHEGLDGLQSDMRRHQERFAPEVTASANQALAAQVMERIEKQDAERKIAPPPVAPLASVPDQEVQTKEIDGKTYTLDKAPDRPMYRSASQFEADVLAHAQPRLEMLLTKRDSGPFGTPSWRDKTMAAMYFKVKSLEAIKAKRTDLAEYYEQAYQLDLAELLEASNQLFGDWRKDAPSRITVSG
jgi:hypothetical protein